MEVDFLEFDWDVGNRKKCEKRYIGIGKTEAGRSVFIAFTLRRSEQGVLLRPISARYMHKKEIEYYEKEASKARKRRRS